MSEGWTLAGAAASLSRERWLDLAPLARRLARLDPFVLVRMRADADHIRLLAGLPSRALVGSTVRSPRTGGERDLDLATHAGALARWLDDDLAVPPRVDSAWLTAIPPERGWQRIETVPGEVVRDLVRQGAEAHMDAANRHLGARAANTLLDAAVLVVSDHLTRVELSNRTLGALTSMGFLPEDGDVIVAVNRRWTRVAAARGSVFAENRTDALSLA